MSLAVIKHQLTKQSNVFCHLNVMTLEKAYNTIKHKIFEFSHNTCF
jgi:hypothetical protein